ncbi:hypothetical protein BpHYR1_022452 [Brachionus plicatilis]|uniref:Uncharacterized protein n=1 Tax=Brachionus plicatilis TaxID=10195 RepID=A0A3M7Q4N6_BRAPC|nr:hypothetical protein BpHYR1_022452 [Brachionus plicatilis]
MTERDTRVLVKHRVNVKIRCKALTPYFLDFKQMKTKHFCCQIWMIFDRLIFVCILLDMIFKNGPPLWKN